MVARLQEREREREKHCCGTWKKKEDEKAKHSQTRVRAHTHTHHTITQEGERERVGEVEKERGDKEKTAKKNKRRFNKRKKRTQSKPCKAGQMHHTKRSLMKIKAKQQPSAGFLFFFPLPSLSLHPPPGPFHETEDEKGEVRKERRATVFESSQERWEEEGVCVCVCVTDDRGQKSWWEEDEEIKRTNKKRLSTP